MCGVEQLVVMSRRGGVSAPPEHSVAGPVPPVVRPGRSHVRLHHQLPRVLHGAGRQQPGRRVSATAQRDHRRL